MSSGAFGWTFGRETVEDMPANSTRRFGTEAKRALVAVELKKRAIWRVFTREVVSQTDTYLPVTKRRPCTHPSSREPGRMPGVRKKKRSPPTAALATVKRNREAAKAAEREAAAAAAPDDAAADAADGEQAVEPPPAPAPAPAPLTADEIAAALDAEGLVLLPSRREGAKTGYPNPNP